MKHILDEAIDSKMFLLLHVIMFMCAHTETKVSIFVFNAAGKQTYFQKAGLVL